jgi:hypothetical protein
MVSMSWVDLSAYRTVPLCVRGLSTYAAEGICADGGLSPEKPLLRVKTVVTAEWMWFVGEPHTSVCPDDSPRTLRVFARPTS